MINCLFCKIIAKQIPSEPIYEDGQVYAFLDIHPTNFGHVLIVPKQHSEGLLDANEAVLTGLLPRTQKIAQAVKTATGAEGINIMQNEGEAAGQVIKHLHIHVIPRWFTDGFTHWHGTDYPSQEKMKEMAQGIRAYLG